MAKDTKYENIDMNSNKITNVPTPVDNSDCVNKSYVDAQISSASGGGAILEWRQFNIGSNSTLDHNEQIIVVDALPGGYYMGELQVRVIGSDISSGKSDVVSLDLQQTSNTSISLMPNEKPLFYQTMGAANQGNRYMRFFFRKVVVSPVDYQLAFQLADTSGNVILAGGKLNIYRIANPVTAWS